MTNLTNITLLLNRYNRNIELLNTLSNSVQKTEDKLKEIKGSEFLQELQHRLMLSEEKLSNLSCDIEERKSLILSIDIRSALECHDNIPESEYFETSNYLNKILKNIEKEYENVKNENIYLKQQIYDHSSFIIATNKYKNINYYKNKKIILQNDIKNIRKDNENIMKNIKQLHFDILEYGEEYANNHFVYKHF